MLDSSGSDLVQRVGNKLYEHCRAGRITLSKFPQFDPILTALKSGFSNQRERSFRVTAQRADSLLILESLGKKWMENEATAEKAKEVVTNHNNEFNSTGDFWLCDSRTGNNWACSCQAIEKHLGRARKSNKLLCPLSQFLGTNTRFQFWMLLQQHVRGPKQKAKCPQFWGQDGSRSS